MRQLAVENGRVALLLVLLVGKEVGHVVSRGKIASGCRGLCLFGHAQRELAELLQVVGKLGAQRRFDQFAVSI